MDSTNKELLFLEQRRTSYIESTLLLSNNNKREDLEPGKKRGAKLLTTPAPTSEVLGRVKDFLGVMAEANKKLKHEAQSKPSDAFDIEALTGNEDEYIEMDLRLGLFDLYTPEAVAAAESAVAGAPMVIPEPVSSSDTDDSDDEEIVSYSMSDGDSEEKDVPQKQRKRPKITEV